MKIGILYNLVEEPDYGPEIEIISDNEIDDPVEKVQQALQDEHEVIPFRVRRESLPNLTRESFDFVFNLCEGIDQNNYAEAWVAAFLDMVGLPFTGSRSFTLGLCMNKIKTKHLLAVNDVPTPPYQKFTSPDDVLDPKLRFPLIVKPALEDGSFAISEDSVVKNRRALYKVIKRILKNLDEPVLVEEYIEGREFNVAVLGNGDDIEVLPISEIVFDLPPDRPHIVTYKAKWVEDSVMYKGTRGVCPTEISADLEARLKKWAVKAYNITGCRDYARVDFRVRDDKCYVLEVNPNPWINVDGGLARSGRAAGMTYDQMIKRILAHAQKRYDIDPAQLEPAVVKSYSTKDLNVREAKIEDMDQILTWFNDPVVGRYMDDPEKTYTKEELIEKMYVIFNDDINLVVFDKHTGERIGFCSAYDLNTVTGSCEVSLLIGEQKYMGKGYSKQILEVLLKAAFENQNITRVEANVVSANNPAKKAFKAAGFRRIGTRKGVIGPDGKSQNEVLFEMTRTDYKAEQPSSDR